MAIKPNYEVKKKKGGIFSKLVLLVFLCFVGFVGYIAYKMYEKKDIITTKNFIDIAKGEVEKIDTEALKAQLMSTINSAKDDLLKYTKELTAERKKEVAEDMADIQKNDKELIAEEKKDKKATKKIVETKKTKKIVTVKDALAVDINKAEEAELVTAVMILKKDFLARYKLYESNKKKNADQKRVAIAHAKIVKQYLIRIYELNNNNEWAVTNKRRVTNSLGMMRSD